MSNTEPTLSGQLSAPATSLGARLTNVFVSPTEAFDQVKNSPPNHANWLVPLVISIIAGIVYTMVVFSQPAIMQQMKQPLEQAIQKKVKDGKISQKMADQQLAAIEPFYSPSVFKVFGIVSVVFMNSGMLFLTGLFFWLIGNFAFRAHFDFMKAVEAIGLANMIGVLGIIIAVPLAVLYGNLGVNIGPVLLLNHFEATNPVHVLLSSLNLLMLWYLLVVAIALARMSGTHFFKAVLWPFGIWILMTAAYIAYVALIRKING